LLSSQDRAGLSTSQSHERRGANVSRCNAIHKKKGAPIGDPLNIRSQEPQLIQRALERYNGNRKRAAQALNISTVTLWRKMKACKLTA